MSTYLLDTNFVIYLSDEQSDADKRKLVLQQMAEKLAEDDAKFVLTPLIRYEVLRGVEWQHTDKLATLKHVLEKFESLDITQDVSDLAMNLYRFDKFQAAQSQQPKNLDKRKFDMFHYATAAVNELAILSHDSDIEKIETLHQQFLKHVQAA